MTADELTEFRESILATLPGYRPPAAYGIGVVSEGSTRFPLTNAGGANGLPAIVLGSVLGYRSGTCTLAVSAGQLDAAIDTLSPAEACEAYDHPNLWSWRDIRAAARPGDRFVAVFVGDAADRPSDDHQDAFRSAASWE